VGTIPGEFYECIRDKGQSTELGWPRKKYDIDKVAADGNRVKDPYKRQMAMQTLPEIHYPFCVSPSLLFQL
jgi:hypothetical protein